jgi:hypothetical protein
MFDAPAPTFFDKNMLNQARSGEVARSRGLRLQDDRLGVCNSQ